MSFPASAYCMIMRALWLVVVLVKQPSLASWSRPNCLRACERKSARESAPAVVMFGLLCKMLSASPVVGRIFFVYVFNDVSV